MKRVTIDTTYINDWQSFHDIFARTLGFSSCYGRNMNAWVDCMTALDCPEEGLTSIQVNKGDVLVIELENFDNFDVRCPEQYNAIVECSSFVNYRRLEQGDSAILLLSFMKK